MRRICITGAAGLLGQHLVNKFKSAAQLLCLDNNPDPFESSANVNYIQVDLLRTALWQKKILDFRPDIIINCAAYSDVDACEDNRQIADRMNIELVDNLLQIPSARIIHYSSDYIFNGEDGPYDEESSPDPINYYGYTKLESEKLLTNSGRDYLIIRTNVLYGLAKNIRPNFITWLVDSLNKQKPVAIVTDQFNNPTYAGNLAEATIESIGLEISGVLHFGGTDYLSRYDASLVVAEFLNRDSGLVNKTTSDQLKQRARRPRRGGLDISKARRILKTRPIGIADGLKLMYS